jgi:hypothetical protein
VSVQFRQRAHRPTLVIDIDPLYNPLPAAGFFTIGVSTIGGVDIIKGD